MQDIIMEPLKLHLQPVPASLQLLTAQERNNLYKTIEADLSLEKLLRNEELISAILCNPYFFMGSRTLKTWLDDTHSSSTFQSSGDDCIQEAPIEGSTTSLSLDAEMSSSKENLSIGGAHSLSCSNISELGQSTEDSDWEGSTQSLPPAMLEELSVPSSLKVRSFSHNNLSITGSPHHVRKHANYKICFQAEQNETTEVIVNRLSKGNYPLSGDVYVRMKHVKEELFVTVVEGRNLTVTSKKGYSNPYIKLYFLPDLKGTKQKTKVEKKTSNPFYNQTFKYQVAKDKLNSHAVWLSVWSKTTLSQQFIGETCVALSSTNLPTTTYKQWLPLEDYSMPATFQSPSNSVPAATQPPSTILTEAMPRIVCECKPVIEHNVIDENGKIVIKVTYSIPLYLVYSHQYLSKKPLNTSSPTTTIMQDNASERALTVSQESDAKNLKMSNVAVHPAEENGSITIAVHPAEKNGSIAVLPAEESGTITVLPTEEKLNDSITVLPAEENGKVTVHSTTEENGKVTVHSTTEENGKVTVHSTTEENGSITVHPTEEDPVTLDTESTIEPSILKYDDGTVYQDGTRAISECSLMTSSMQHPSLSHPSNATDIPVEVNEGLTLHQTDEEKEKMSSEWKQSKVPPPPLTVSTQSGTTQEELIEHVIYIDALDSPSNRVEFPVTRSAKTLGSLDNLKAQKKSKDFRSSTPNLSSGALEELSVPSSLKVRSFSHNNLSITGSPHHVRKHANYKIAFQAEQNETIEVIVDRLSKGDYPLSGDVYVRMKHVKEELFVTVVEGRNLTVTSKKGYSNPYIKLYFLPDLKGTKQKTKVEKKTSNPFYNQTFKYQVAKEKLDSHAVWLSVWSKTTLSQQFIGETCVALSSTNLPTTTYKQWLPLEDYSEPTPSGPTLHTDDILSSTRQPLAVNFEDESYQHPVETTMHSQETDVSAFHSVDQSSVGPPYQADHEFPPNLDPAEKRILEDLFSTTKKKQQSFGSQDDDKEPSSLANSTSTGLIPKREGIELASHFRGIQSGFASNYPLETIPEAVTLSLYLTDSDSNTESSPMHKHSAAAALSSEISLASKQQYSSLDDLPSIDDEPTHLKRKRSTYKIASRVKQGPAGPAHFGITINRISRGDYPLKGDVYVRMKHVKDTLFVTVVEGRSFPATSKKGYSNPYIKLYLLPDLKGTKQKTKVEKKTLNPFYNQTFKYRVAKDKLNSHAVWLSVWSKTTLSQQFIGETCVALSAANVAKKAYQQWLPLEDYAESMSQSSSHSRTLAKHVHEQLI